MYGAGTWPKSRVLAVYSKCYLMPVAGMPHYGRWQVLMLIAKIYIGKALSYIIGHFPMSNNDTGNHTPHIWATSLVG